VSGALACDINRLVEVVFSGLSSLVIEDVTELDGGVIVVRARTAGGLVPCPRCGAGTGQVHGYCERTVADGLYRFNTYRTASDLRIHEISYAAR
jgi:hypothetical protein